MVGGMVTQEGVRPAGTPCAPGCIRAVERDKDEKQD